MVYLREHAFAGDLQWIHVQTEENPMLQKRFYPMFSTNHPSKHEMIVRTRTRKKEKILIALENVAERSYLDNLSRNCSLSTTRFSKDQCKTSSGVVCFPHGYRSHRTRMKRPCHRRSSVGCHYETTKRSLGDVASDR